MEKQEYIDYLNANENDTATRLEYADWLDANGEHEEADRQRKWPAAKTWLVEMCQKFGNFDEPLPGVGISKEIIQKHKDGVAAIHAKFPWLKDIKRPEKPAPAASDYDYDSGMSYKKLIEIGHYGIKTGYMSVGSHEDIGHELNMHRQEFWENWSIVTGEKVEIDKVANGYFGCSC